MIFEKILKRIISLVVLAMLLSGSTTMAIQDTGPQGIVFPFQ